jgi:hypothetical protein
MKKKHFICAKAAAASSQQPAASSQQMIQQIKEKYHLLTRPLPPSLPPHHLLSRLTHFDGSTD